MSTRQAGRLQERAFAEQCRGNILHSYWRTLSGANCGVIRVLLQGPGQQSATHVAGPKRNEEQGQHRSAATAPATGSV